MTNTNKKNVIEHNLAKRHILPKLFVSHPKQLAFLAHASFDAEEGEFESSPNLMVTLCTNYGGRFCRHADNACIDDQLVKGAVAVALPKSPAQGFWAKTELLGLSINLDACELFYQLDYSAEQFGSVASKILHDPLLNAIMVTLWRDGELHGSASCFFDEGIQQILSRLTEYAQPKIVDRMVLPLQGNRLTSTIELIESRLQDDLSIAELAQNAQQDVRTFSRAFKTTFACAPYAYLTRRRMIRAQALLLTDISITDIANLIGYDNPSKFAAAFRRYTCVSPSQWRNSKYMHS